MHYKLAIRSVALPGRYQQIHVWDVNQNVSNVSVGSKCINVWDWNLRHCLSTYTWALKAKKFKIIYYKNLLCSKSYCLWKWMKSPKLVSITRKIKKKMNAKMKRIEFRRSWGHKRFTQRNRILKKNTRDIDSRSAVQHTTNKKGSTKAANGRRKEERAGFEESLTPDQLCKTKQIKSDQQKAASVRRTEKRAVFEESLTPDQLCKTHHL